MCIYVHVDPIVIEESEVSYRSTKFSEEMTLLSLNLPVSLFEQYVFSYTNTQIC